MVIHLSKNIQIFLNIGKCSWLLLQIKVCRSSINDDGHQYLQTAFFKIIMFGIVRNRYATGYVIGFEPRVHSLLLLFITELGGFNLWRDLNLHLHPHKRKQLGQKWHCEVLVFLGQCSPRKRCPFSTGSLLMDISRHLLTVIVCGKGIVKERTEQ